jgi:putative IMPACT (imprinted ancient) family translation regulator
MRSIKETTTNTIIIKKSEFITTLIPCNDEKEIKDGVKKAIGDSVKVANEVKINDAKSRARQLRRDN